MKARWQMETDQQQEWYYKNDGKQVGPVSKSRVRQLVISGIIRHDTRVRRRKGNRWIRAIELKGLFDASGRLRPQKPPRQEPFTNTMNKYDIIPTGMMSRMANTIIDTIALIALGAGLGLFLGLAINLGLHLDVVAEADAAIFVDSFLHPLSLSRWFFGVAGYCGYYVLLESTTGMTLGKLLTGTKVVREDGGKPTLLQVIVRTIARFVPFDWVSFISDQPKRGWHDSLSRTVVVDTFVFNRMVADADKLRRKNAKAASLRASSERYVIQRGTQQSKVLTHDQLLAKVKQGNIKPGDWVTDTIKDKAVDTRDLIQKYR